MTGPVDPELLRAEIERTRADLGGTIEELAARANVVARARRAVRRARSRLRIAGPSLIAGALVGGGLGVAAGLIYLARRRSHRP